MNISVITPVNKPDEYIDNVLGTLKDDSVEFIPINNADSAAKALNEGIEKAKNDICVLCHQDVRFPQNWLDDIEGLDNNKFGVCGVWGITLDGYFAGHVITPVGRWLQGNLPIEAQCVDELLMIIRKSSGLRFDESLGGWHLYGADICLEAEKRGLSNWIIDACVTHLSMGKLDDAFEKCKKELMTKWSGHGPPRIFKTTCTTINL